MVDLKVIGLFLGLSLPSWLLVLVSADAVLVLAEDVFLIALLQILFVGLFMWRSWEPSE
jgi:hypothetical protein